MQYYTNYHTLIAIDFIYSKFSELCPTPCLGIASTPPAFTKIPPPFPGYQKLSTKKIPTPPTLLPLMIIPSPCLLGT